jgi:hypothetical protein
MACVELYNNCTRNSHTAAVLAAILLFLLVLFHFVVSLTRIDKTSMMYQEYIPAVVAVVYHIYFLVNRHM